MDFYNMPNPVGRPTIYNQVIADEICDVISSRAVGLNILCKEYDHWPDPDTVWKWRSRHPEFAEKYTLAKCHQIEVMVDEMLDITNTVKRIPAHVMKAKLQVDTRKWFASKLAPKLYGDKMIKQHDVEPSLMQVIIDKL